MLPRVVRLDATISATHQKVFACLLNVNANSEPRTTLRVAGGWVRDMMLGLHSNDIDIAIETAATIVPVSGEAFARRVAEYQRTHGDREHTVSVIRANPSMSKHIETATLRVCEIPVEFCALRTDVYTDYSRIPDILPGTPLEDARRRDFTINALFYNLHTGMVEDYTTGLEDLQRRLLRCPLEPRTTFTDDPLRLLRGVRFVGQLGDLDFSLDPSVIECVDPPLLTALLMKVSRERMGKELVKMLAAPRPERCIALLSRLRILQLILLVSVAMKTEPGKKQALNEIERIDRLVNLFPDGDERLAQTLRLCEVALPSLAALSLTPAMKEEHQVEVALFCLLVAFFRDSTGDRTVAVRNVCINGLKLSVASADCVRRLLDAYCSLRNASLTAAELTTASLAESTLRKLFDAAYQLNDGHVFPNALQVVLFVYFVLEKTPSALQAAETVPQVAEAFMYIWAAIAGHPTLLTAFQLRLPVNGKELQKVYGLEPKSVGSTLLKMRLKRVLSPEMSADDIAGWLRMGAPL